MNSRTDVIEALANNEEILGKLYQAYALRFLDYQDFFTGLAVEEMNHAGWIRKMDVGVKEGRFKIEAIRSFTRYLNGELSKTEQVSLRQALTLARYIEEALIERRYFEIFEGDSPELKSVLTQLAMATEHHLDRVRKTLAQLGQ